MTNLGNVGYHVLGLRKFFESLSNVVDESDRIKGKGGGNDDIPGI